MQPEHVQQLHKRIAWTTDTRDQRNKQLPLVFNAAQFLMHLAQKVKLFSIYQPVGLPPAKSARHQNAVWLFTDADRGQTARATTCSAKNFRTLPISAASSCSISSR